MTRTLFRRTALFGLLLPFLYFGTASATFLYRIHAENSARGGARLAALPAPNARQRLVIFSPHPDDETLGCAGLIQQAEEAGARVRVVFLTNGDGFRVAVERQYHQLRVGPRDYEQFAALRQQEVYHALANLGVGPEDISFFGYPDRGLLALWNDHWSPNRLYTSPYTRCSRSPYGVAYHPGAPYCGQSVLSDVKDILRREQPTDVYVTHPSDDHVDHTAASSFVTLALQELQQEGDGWARGCRLHYYLVHRGDWPAPQGTYTSDALVPPTDMAALDTSWQSLPLNPEQVDEKMQSILAYESQTSVMKRFLVSFARRNELFGTLDTVPVPRINEGQAPRWDALKPVALDAVNDNLLRDFQGGGDIRALYACRDAANLYLRVETYQPVSRRVDYRLGIRYFGDATEGEGGGALFTTVRPGGKVSPPELETGVSDGGLDITVPLCRLGYARRIAVDVNTSFAGILVDRTGYRFLTL